MKIIPLLVFLNSSILKKGDSINYSFVACNSSKAQEDAISITSKNGSINLDLLRDWLAEKGYNYER